jgi:hypothetical protein
MALSTLDTPTGAAVVKEGGGAAAKAAGGVGKAGAKKLPLWPGAAGAAGAAAGGAAIGGKNSGNSGVDGGESGDPTKGAAPQTPKPLNGTYKILVSNVNYTLYRQSGVLRGHYSFEGPFDLGNYVNPGSPSIFVAVYLSGSGFYKWQQAVQFKISHAGGVYNAGFFPHATKWGNPNDADYMVSGSFVPQVIPIGNSPDPNAPTYNPNPSNPIPKLSPTGSGYLLSPNPTPGTTPTPTPTPNPTPTPPGLSPFPVPVFPGLATGPAGAGLGVGTSGAPGLITSAGGAASTGGITTPGVTGLNTGNQQTPIGVTVTPQPCNPAGSCAAGQDTANQNNANQNQQNASKLDAILAALQGLDLGLLNVINNKLGNQIPNGGLGGATGRIFKMLRIDRFLNVANNVLLLHNAIMLSRSLVDTLGSAVDTVMQATGFQFQDEKGDQMDFTDVLGNSLMSFAVSAFGEEQTRVAIAAWRKANRIYQSAANVISSLREIGDSLYNIAEIGAERISIIGNALQDANVVMDNSYERFEEEFGYQTRFSRNFQKFQEGIEQAQESLEAITEIAEEVINIQEAFQEIEENQEQFKQAQQELRDIAQGEYDEEKLASEVDTEIDTVHFAKAEDEED